MKRGILILITAILIGLVSYKLTRQSCCCSVSDAASVHDGTSMLPELEWLHHELKLTDEQFAKVKALHLAYKPVCEALCMKIAAAHREVKRLTDAGELDTATLVSALQAQASVRAECQQAMLKHLQETAKAVSPAQSKQYLDAMLPQVLGNDLSH